MKDYDALFFHQIIIPMLSVRKSEIRKDPWKYFYSEVEKWSDIYVDQLGIEGVYSKKFEHMGF